MPHTRDKHLSKTLAAEENWKNLRHLNTQITTFDQQKNDLVLKEPRLGTQKHISFFVPQIIMLITWHFSWYVHDYIRVFETVVKEHECCTEGPMSKVPVSKYHPTLHSAANEYLNERWGGGGIAARKQNGHPISKWRGSEWYLSKNIKIVSLNFVIFSVTTSTGACVSF